MGLQWIPALTGAEFLTAGDLKGPIAWMACHFSHRGPGLSNLPERFPTGSYLILDDSQPIGAHDPVFICKQLEQWGSSHGPGGIILDLQRPGVPETKELARELTQLPWQVAVSDVYGEGFSCPVFLSAVPPHRTLAQHLQNWKGREIWLEIALETEIATVTEGGSWFSYGPVTEDTRGFFPEKSRHMCYRVETAKDRATVTMVRKKEHLPAFLEEAETLGIKKAIGLYSRLGIEI